MVLKAGALVGSIVVGVGDEALGVALDELLHQVRTIVPHGGVIAGTEALHAQLLDQILGSGVEAVVGNHGVKVGAGAGAGEHQRVIIGSFHADTGSQHILVGHVSGSVALVLGQVVVIGSAHHSLGGHGGVESLVLESVQDPLKAHQEVFAGQVALHLAVDVAPVHIVAQVERPDGGVVVVLPALGDGGRNLAVAVKAQQTVPHVGGDVQIGGGLAVQEVPGLQLTVGGLERNVIGDGVCGSSRSTGSGAGCSSAAGAAAASCQDACGTHHAGRFQEAAAADGTGLKVHVHSVILPIIFLCYGTWCRARRPAGFPLFCASFAPGVLPWNTKERRNRPLCLCLCSSRKILNTTYIVPSKELVVNGKENCFS